MLSAKSLLLVAFLALFNLVAATVPPGCLLAAANKQKDPGDFKTICGSSAKKFQEVIADVCPEDNVQPALKAYAKVCSEHGKKVALIALESSTSTTLATKTASASVTGSVTATASATATGGSETSGSSPSGTASGSASASAPVSTGAAYSFKAQTWTVGAIAAIVGAVAL